MKYGKRKDANHKPIKEGLRDAGYIVIDMSDVGHGVPDLAVQHPLGTPAVWLELKDGEKSPSARELTEKEERWLSLVPDRTFTVLNLDQALKVCEEFFK